MTRMTVEDSDEPIVLKCKRRSAEHLRRINRVQAVGFQIGFALYFIPLVPHIATTNCIYNPDAAQALHSRDKSPAAPPATIRQVYDQRAIAARLPYSQVGEHGGQTGPGP
jgi:hypothetical protein